MKVAFIGAGKVGKSLGSYWAKKGIKILGYYSRSIQSAKEAALLTESSVFNTIASLAEEADLIMITTPDDEIEKVAYDLSNILLPWDKKIVCHTSGSLSSEILSLLNNKGATIYSLHPMLSFADVNSAKRGLENTFFTVEGKGPKESDFKKLLDSCKHTYKEICTENKALYHTSACIVSNYLVTLLDTGIELLDQAGFSEETAIALIEPLIRKTLDNSIRFGTKKALTGPISRGDVGTVHTHIKKLVESGNQEWLQIYKTMGNKTVKLAESAKKINGQTAKKLYEELGKYE